MMGQYEEATASDSRDETAMPIAPATGDYKVLTEAGLQRAAWAAKVARPEFGEFFLSRFLGLELVYNDSDRSCSVELPYSSFLTNPQGAMHGGVIATALDISMGHLCHRYLSISVTVDLHVRFLKPLTTAARCDARLLHSSTRSQQLESRATDETGELVALATAAWRRVPGLSCASPTNA